jgi:hypothetical protein
MKALKLAVPAGILMAGFMLCTTASYGTQEISKKEKKGCVTCHVTPGKKDLNTTGKCYKESKALDKCAPADKK